jgi:hypothetical protein
MNGRMLILAALSNRTPEMSRHQAPSLANELVWVLAAALLGFATTALFSGFFEWRRDWFVAIYALLVGSFLYGYIRWSGVDLRSFLLYRWIWGVVGMLVVGAILVASVQRMPASPPASGLALAWDILWLGIADGVLDALLLTVLPVAVTWRAFSAARWTASWPGKIAAGAVAFVASLGVTAAYHLGYVEFRGPQIIDPLIGNGIMTLGYVLTGSPLTAIGAHVALHVASVLHGIETTVTLPPHY